MNKLSQNQNIIKTIDLDKNPPPPAIPTNNKKPNEPQSQLTTTCPPTW